MKKNIFASIASLFILGSIASCSVPVPKTFTATFYDETGITIIKQTTFLEGTTPAYPADPTKEEDETYTYTFDKWVDAVGSDKEVSFANASNDVNAYASFNENYKDYTITFILNNGDNDIIQHYHYGDEIVPPTDFAKLGYTFVSWDKEVGQSVTKNDAYTAIWEINKYNVIWKNGDTVLEVDENVEYGAYPSYDGETPTKAKENGYTYSFKGWGLVQDGEDIDIENQKITADTTYYALFNASKEQFTITFKNEGEVISSKTYSYGDEVEIPSTPKKEADENYVYKFAGWDKEVTKANGNETYEATYSAYSYKDGFISSGDGLTLTKTTLAGSDVIEASGIGNINFKGAFLETDDFFDNYTHLSFEFLYGQTSTDNMINTTGVSSWFRTDYVEDNGIKGVSDFIRVYENGTQVYKMNQNNWYTFSLLVRKEDAGVKFSLENVYLSLYDNHHQVYLRNLRFGNTWLYDTFAADSLGFEAEDDAVGIGKTTKDNVDVIKATSKEGKSNANVVFKDVYNATGEKEFFYRNYNHISFEIFVESDNADGKFFHTTWAGWSWVNFNGYNWTNDGEKGTYFSSYDQTGNKVNVITVGQWYKVDFLVNHSGNRADNIVKIDIAGSVCYFKNLAFYQA